jgi:hypothetical protein
MTITSKFNGKCKKCGGVIRQGEQIDWSKDHGSHHITCPESPKKPGPYQGKFRRLEKAYTDAEKSVAAEQKTSTYQAYVGAMNKIKSDQDRSLWLREAARVLDLSSPAAALNDVKTLLQLQQMRV